MYGACPDRSCPQYAWPYGSWPGWIAVAVAAATRPYKDSGGGSTFSLLEKDIDNKYRIRGDDQEVLEIVINSILTGIID